MTAIPDADELFARAERLAPLLRARSDEAEQLRRCPDETIDAFVENGLLRICQPKRYGGYELGWDVLCGVAQRLARGCGSQAWIQDVFSDHQQKLGQFPDEAQDDVWAADANARISASIDPVGTATRVAGGVRYSGHHRFASGIDHAQWLICGGRIIQDEGHAERCFFLLPKSDVSIVDDWFVIGLCGTGSKAFEVADVFIPDHRILAIVDVENGTGPGTQVNTAGIYRLGIPQSCFAAVGVGIAEGFLEEYVRFTRPRKSRGVAVAELGGTQISIGVACAEIESAALVNSHVATSAMHAVSDGKHLSRQQKLRGKRDSAYACQVVLATVMRLYNSAGGRALAQGNAMERQLRDLIAVASHHSIVWDDIAREYGELRLNDASTSLEKQ